MKNNQLLIKFRKYILLLFFASMTCFFMSVLFFGVPFLKNKKYEEIFITSAEVKIVGKPYSSKIRIVGKKKYYADCYGTNNFCQIYLNKTLKAQNLKIIKYYNDIFIQNGMFLDEYDRFIKINNIFTNSELVDYSFDLKSHYFYLFLNITFILILFIFVCEIYFWINRKLS